MSTVLTSIHEVGRHEAPVVAIRPAGRRLHRLGTVRQQEEISRRTVARQLKTSITEVKRQEDETADLPLSALYEWQKVLDVPMSELLLEPDEPLSSPVRNRAKMLRVMKTAVTILERARQAPVRRMAQMLVEQLVELMPELEGVSPWPAVGKSRLPSEYGQVIHRRLPDEIFLDSDDE